MCVGGGGGMKVGGGGSSRSGVLGFGITGFDGLAFTHKF